MHNNSRGAVSNHHHSNNLTHNQRVNHNQHHGSMPHNANPNMRASQNVPNRAATAGAHPGANQQRAHMNSNHHGHHPNKPQQNHVNPQQRVSSGNMQQQQQRPPNQMNRPNQSQSGNTNQPQQQQQATPQQPPLPNVLPKGFKREEVVRTKGISAGIVDIVYTATIPPTTNGSNEEPAAPAKQKFRSKLELHKKIGDKYDMALLDYRTGKISQMVWRKQRRMKSLASTTNTNYASAAKYDVYLNLPIRQTSSVFKQTVSYVTNNHKNEAPPEHVLTQKTDRPKPVQLFWELRFDNLKAIDTQYQDECDLNTDFDLDNKIKFNNFPLSNENILRSVAASWYLNQNKILMGQDIKEFTKNPRVFIDRDQPVIPAMSIKEDEIQQQEAKVKELRKQMEIALNELKHLDNSILNGVDLKYETNTNNGQELQMDVELNEEQVDGIKVEQN